MKNNANIILDLGQTAQEKSIRFEETLDLKSKLFEESLVEMEQKMVRIRQFINSHAQSKSKINPG